MIPVASIEQQGEDLICNPTTGDLQSENTLANIVCGNWKISISKIYAAKIGTVICGAITLLAFHVLTWDL